MASGFTTNKGLELQATGENNGTWGIKNNANFSLLDAIVGATLAVAISVADVNLTMPQCCNAILRLTGALTGNRLLTVPGIGGFWIVDNQTTGAFTVSVRNLAGGRSTVARQGEKTYVFSDATNVDPVQTAGLVWTGTTGGTTTNYTGTLPGNIVSLTTGLALGVVFNATNAINPTYNPSGIGAKKLYKPSATGPAQLAANDVIALQACLLVYDLALDAGVGGFHVLGGLSYVPASRLINTTAGDLTGGGALSADLTLGLATTAVTAAAYGSATQVPSYTVDTKGRLTAAANVAINVASSLGYTPVNRAGDNLTGAVNATRVTVASAATSNIGAALGEVIDFTGTATVTAFDNAQAGTRRTLRCASTPIFTHNAAIILPGAQNYPARANDALEFVSLGSGTWYLANILRVSAPPPVGPSVLAAKTGTYTPVPADDGAMIRYTGTGGHTIAPPNAGVQAGYELTIRNDSTTSAQTFVTINPGGAAQIDGQASRDLYPQDRVTIVFDGTNYWTKEGKWIFVSADTAVPGSGSLGQLPHGLGVVPRKVWVYLVCLTNDAGWLAATPDVVLYASAQQNTPSTANRGVAVYADVTNVNFQAGADANYLAFFNKSTGVDVNLNQARWAWRIIAEM